jgi:hypothetical protein
MEGTRLLPGGLPAGLGAGRVVGLGQGGVKGAGSLGRGGGPTGGRNGGVHGRRSGAGSLRHGGGTRLAPSSQRVPLRQAASPGSKGQRADANAARPGHKGENTHQVAEQPCRPDGMAITQRARYDQHGMATMPQQQSGKDHLLRG